jgi:hypothetical protein
MSLLAAAADPVASKVFQNMVPSDSTKVTVTMQDCTALMPPSNRPGALSIDVGHCSFKTRMLASSTSRNVDCRLADVAMSLSDNFAVSVEGRRNEGSPEVNMTCHYSITAD